MNANLKTEVASKREDRQPIESLVDVYSGLNRLYLPLDQNNFSTNLRDFIKVVRRYNNQLLFRPDKRFRKNGQLGSDSNIQAPPLDELYWLLGCKKDISNSRIQLGWPAPDLRNDYRIDSEQVYINLARALHEECRFAISLGEVRSAMVAAQNIGTNPTIRIHMNAKHIFILDE